MKKRITSKHRLFGYVYHYDENSKCIGKSRPSLMGDGKIHYNANGKQVGTSRPGFIAKEVYHDEENEQYISSYEGLTGDVFFDSGTPVGTSHPGISGTKYITFDAAEEAEEAFFDQDAEDNLQDSAEYGRCKQREIISNIIIFAACFLVFGILFLIFKQ